MDSWLTFLPAEKYLRAEIFFLPPLRILVWLMTSATIHLVLRLTGRPGDIDRLLNIGGMGYLVTMPFVLASDWLLVAMNAYPIAEYTHPLVAVWGAGLGFIGVKKLLGLQTGLALVLSAISFGVSIPLLAIFAR